MWRVIRWWRRFVNAIRYSEAVEYFLWLIGAWKTLAYHYADMDWQDYAEDGESYDEYVIRLSKHFKQGKIEVLRIIKEGVL